MMKRFAQLGLVVAFLFSTSLLSTSVQAAQVGKIIVDEAELHEYPQAGSRVLAKIAKGEAINVSNVPTEGFYKARIKTGEIGWISGNDILVKKGAAKGGATVARRRPSEPEDMRLQLTYGIDSLSYSGMSSVFTTTGMSGKGFTLEGQFRLNQNWFWAIRTEYHTGSQTGFAVNATTTQAIAQTLMPVQVGAIYALMHGEKFRLNAGVYLGMSIVSSTTISWSTTTAVEEVKYSSLDPCGTLTLGGAYALSDAFGALLELGYRYHKTGEFPSTTRFGGKSGFSINNSGITIRLGLELKL